MPNLEIAAQYQALIQQISTTYLAGNQQAIRSVNTAMIVTYWQIGQYITEFEQKGKLKAEYGKGLLENLAKDLKVLHGKGFSRSNLTYMRLFYQCYPICATASHKLGWSHFVELLKIEDELARKFYENQAILENWSVAELKRQKQTALFQRFALGKNKAEILKLANEGKKVSAPEDILKEPYIFEFLKIPEPYHIHEAELEQKLFAHLQQFLLELGKGFTFVGRQYRITLNNTHFYVDMVFYHRILRCFVLIDFKIREFAHYDIGQMNMYMGYFAKEENIEGDNPPIGIILTQEKDELMVEYAMYGMSSPLFVQKYQLYLPNKEELQRLVLSQMKENEA